MPTMSETKKIIVTPEEVENVENANEKRSALKNLIFICDENPLIRNEDLYHKFIESYTAINKTTEETWEKLANKYDFVLDDNHKAYLNFMSREITLYSDENI